MTAPERIQIELDRVDAIQTLRLLEAEAAYYASKESQSGAAPAMAERFRRIADELRPQIYGQ
ncbi:MAG: hypothetical protein KC442_11670 [Thermomicrobiales bacterium]|nr:hypothetical protein [Thermomicrobiales bacterium]